MNTLAAMTILHILLAFALLYSQFCRSIKTDYTTHAPLLMAFYALTAASLLALFAPAIIPGWAPSWDVICLMASYLCVQATTARYWRHDQPRSFRHADDHCAVDSRPN